MHVIHDGSDAFIDYDSHFHMTVKEERPFGW